jgi:hypothetical protein
MCRSGALVRFSGYDIRCARYGASLIGTSVMLPRVCVFRDTLLRGAIISLTAGSFLYRHACRRVPGPYLTDGGDDGARA